MNIVIVGRPNVGKSSIFNRLLGKKRALVLDVPGVTRDRIVEPATFWVRAREYSVNLIDTGGLGPGQFQDEIRIQVETALTEADVVLFVMDVRAGLTSGDREVFQQIRKSGLTEKVPIIGILNKADAEHFDDEFGDFYELGLDRLMPLSAEHALGIDDLKDVIIDTFYGEDAEANGKVSSPEEEQEPVEDKEVTDEDKLPEGFEEDDEVDEEMLEEASLLPGVEATPKKPRRIPRIAIIGQPNVGKSTILNAICGEKRTIVSPIAGTTVDAIDLKINWNGHDFILIDTAGIRRKNKTEQGIEVLSVVQTRKTLERADLTFFLIDAEKGVYDQDEKIAGLIEEAGSSVIMVLNKWDTQENNDEFSQKLAEEQLREQIRFLGFAPLVFTTATKSLGLDRLFRVAEHVLTGRSLKIPTKELTNFIRDELVVHNPNSAKVYFVHQAGRNPPTFVAHVNDPRKIHFSLSRHLIKAIRGKWGFQGTPIRFHFLKSKNSNE